MLPTPKRGRIAALLLGSLFAVACDDDPEATEMPWNPSLGADAGAPGILDAGGPPPTSSSDGSLTPAPEASVGQDSGVPPSQDAAPPLQEAGPSPTADAAASDGGASDAGPAPSGDGGSSMCCPDGDCLCHGPSPTALTSDRGPYMTRSYTVAGAGCVYYPTNAEGQFAAVAVSDGFLGSGGCGSFQTGGWGPFYASWGIVTMIVDTGSLDTPDLRGAALAQGIAAFKAENTKAGSPLQGKLAGRYGTSGFSMGGGGTTYAAQDDKTLRTNVAIMPWGPVTSGVTVPTLVICGSSDGTASCTSHGTPAYRGIANDVPKMRVVVSSGHAGNPSAGGGESGRVGLAFQKVFLEGDTRWRPLLVGAMAEDTNIR